MSDENHPIAARLRETLRRALAPSELAVIDDSARHAKHAHMIERAGTAAGVHETHFKIKVVSEQFAGKSRLDRHRAINALIADEMGPDGVHAIAIDARAPGE